MSNQSNFEAFAYEFGTSLKAEAIRSATNRDTATADQRIFQSGLTLAYINVLQLLLDRSKTFDLLPRTFNLESFDPDTLH